MTPRLAVIPGDGIGTVRKHLLSLPLGVRVVGLLLVSLAATGCRPADVPVAPRRDLADLDHLLRLMEQRLTLMHEVARWKWNAGKPITDPQREREVLQGVVECSRGKGLAPDLVRSFFAAQLESARLVQQADFERWMANKQKPFADTTSLAVLRQRIDALNRELIEALAEVHPGLSGQTVQQVLPKRAEEILTGNGLAGVRETAIAPLRRWLAEVAADAGFSDQSQFSHHFKRVVGVTPRQFRMSARIA